MFANDADDEAALEPVPNWMKTHPLYGTGQIAKLEIKAYPAGLHDGTVNLPGFTKNSRIVSTKVPPMFSPEHDTGEDYTILDWAEEVKNWCMICEVELVKSG